MHAAKLQKISASPAHADHLDLSKSLPPEFAPLLAIIEKLAVVLDSTPALQPAEKSLAVWVTLDQAAEYLGLSRTFLERLVKDRKLRAVKDRSIKVRKADLDALEF